MDARRILAEAGLRLSMMLKEAFCGVTSSIFHLSRAQIASPARNFQKQFLSNKFYSRRNWVMIVACLKPFFSRRVYFSFISAFYVFLTCLKPRLRSESNGEESDRDSVPFVFGSFLALSLLCKSAMTMHTIRHGEERSYPGRLKDSGA